MNTWKAVIYLLASGQGLLVSLALLSRLKKNKSSFFLGLIIMICSLEMLNFWGMQVKYHASPTAFPFWDFISYLFLPPALWLFIELNTNPSFRFKKKMSWLFAPAIAQILFSMGLTILVRINKIDRTISLLEIKPYFFITEVVPILGMFAGVFLFGKRLYSLSQQVKSLSNFPTLHLVKLYSLFFFFLLITMLWAAGVLWELPIFEYVEVQLVVFLFLLGYIGYFKPNFFEVPKILFRENKKPISAFSNYNDEKALEHLNKLFKEDALYTRPKLSLKELSTELKLPTRYVSYLINTYHSTNFHEFVNSYRVREVIQKLKKEEEQHKTILALALESGFSSKSSFNQVFKTHTGKSPSQYLSLKKP
ncbi:AraC family transcriptional regulator [Cytophagales bacterium RKSG123]|nr:AraC family transcriptional regulator [Xanthovirga aplysinae]